MVGKPLAPSTRAQLGAFPSALATIAYSTTHNLAIADIRFGVFFGVNKFVVFRWHSQTRNAVDNIVNIRVHFRIAEFVRFRSGLFVRYGSRLRAIQRCTVCVS